jgi:hypothetical protein
MIEQEKKLKTQPKDISIKDAQSDSAYQSALIGILDDKTAESTAAQKAELKKKLAYMRDRDREIVKGVFRYHQKPGQTITFTFYNYAGDKLENYKMTDGMTYSIRRDVARHLNKEGLQPVYEWVKDEIGQPVMQVTRYMNRCSFDSMDFFELEDIMPSKKILQPHRIVAPDRFS